MREIKRHLREECRDRVGVVRSLQRRSRHVELLLDDRRADRGKANHQRDHLQVRRCAQQAERFAAADAAFLGLAMRSRCRRCSRRSMAITSATQTPRIAALTSSRLLVPTFSTARDSERRAHRAPEAGAAADEAEQPLGLARVVDIVGERPELADQQDTEDQPEEVERHRHPARAGLEQEPEDHQDHAAQPCVTGMTDRRGKPRDPAAVAAASARRSARLPRAARRAGCRRRDR